MVQHPSLSEQLSAEHLRAGQTLGFGYVVSNVSIGGAVELTLAKGARAFVVWLRPVGDQRPCYWRNAEIAVGYEGQPPDADGLRVVDQICRLADRAPAAILALVDSAILPMVGAVASAIFDPIHREWLASREQALAARFARLPATRGQAILLVNATKGLQFYPSIVDFFARLQDAHPAIQVTGSSYFDVREFQQGVGEKGLRTVPIGDLAAWGTAEINRFAVVLFIGPSAAMVRLMSLPGVTARLVLLDLGFYHQLIESNPDAFHRRNNITWRALRWRTAWLRQRSPQHIPVAAYSCQPTDKIATDLAMGGSALRLVTWHQFNYIPIGFSYCTRKYFRTETRAFDVAFLGASGRDYTHLDPRLFRGMRFLFLGKVEEAPEIESLRTALDITVVSRVDEDTYARLLALCRCVVLPLQPSAKNVLLSVVDAIAAGKALVTPRHTGLARLEHAGLPAVFYDAGSRADLFRQVSELLQDDARLREIEATSITFARDVMDIYRILWTILDEQVL